MSVYVKFITPSVGWVIGMASGLQKIQRQESTNVLLWGRYGSRPNLEQSRER